MNDSFNCKIVHVLKLTFHSFAKGFEIINQIMPDKKTPISNSHHLKNVKQQFRNRQLIETIIELININDHSSLAYIARNDGIPPQLRHLVWPILLKYHPMCISPNIFPNTVSWDSTTNSYHALNDKQKQHQLQPTSSKNTDTEDTEDNNLLSSSSTTTTTTNTNNNHDLESTIIHDLKKYFHTRHHSTNSNGKEQLLEDTLSIHEEHQIIEILKNTILKFLNKWSQIFKYENGLAWVALGLAEWCSPLPNNDNNLSCLLYTSRCV